MRCECEHVRHFEDEILAPSTKKGHEYNAEFDATEAHDVETPYGTFTVCSDCDRDCFTFYG